MTVLLYLQEAVLESVSLDPPRLSYQRVWVQLTHSWTRCHLPQVVFFFLLSSLSLLSSCFFFFLHLLSFQLLNSSLSCFFFFFFSSFSVVVVFAVYRITWNTVCCRIPSEENRCIPYQKKLVLEFHYEFYETQHLDQAEHVSCLVFIKTLFSIVTSQLLLTVIFDLPQQNL